MIAKCPDHGKIMKLVPAGVSKRTGKPYAAFYGCPVYDCKRTAPATDEVEQEPTVEDSMEQVKEFEKELEEGDYTSQGKDEGEEAPITPEEKMWRDKEERSASRDREKNEQIARLTLAKSFIQAGVDFDTARKENDLEKWIAWVLKG